MIVDYDSPVIANNSVLTFTLFWFFCLFVEIDFDKTRLCYSHQQLQQKQQPQDGDDSQQVGGEEALEQTDIHNSLATGEEDTQ